MKNKSNGNYYAGHEISWMRQFLNVVPKGYRKYIAFSIASAICHLHTYKKSKKFLLTHSIQQLFGIHRQTLPVYLKIFQQNGLIKFSQKFGCAFEIELLYLPKYTNKITSTITKVTKITGKKVDLLPNHDKQYLSDTRHPPVGYTTGNVSDIRQVNVSNKRQVNQRRKEPSKKPSKEGTIEGRNHRRKDGSKDQKKDRLKVRREGKNDS